MYPNGLIIVGGDFNYRFADYNSIDNNLILKYSSLKKKRLSMDMIINQRGKQIIDIMQNNDILLINGRSQSIRKFKSGKATGEDNISIEFYKNIPENWLYYLNLLFNKIMDSVKIPDSQTKIIARMIYKNKESICA